jgi:hypothetical protein
MERGEAELRLGGIGKWGGGDGAGRRRRASASSATRASARDFKQDNERERARVEREARTGGVLKAVQGQSERRVRHRPRRPVDAGHAASTGRASDGGHVHAWESENSERAARAAGLGRNGYGPRSEAKAHCKVRDG